MCRSIDFMHQEDRRKRLSYLCAQVGQSLSPVFPTCSRLAILAATLSVCSAQTRPAEVFRKVCGTCHPIERAAAGPRSKAQWQETLDKMVLLGAKASDQEFETILNYLASEYGRDAATPGRGAAPARRFFGAGADDMHVVDDAAADRGRKIWAADCINCHGTYA